MKRLIIIIALIVTVLVGYIFVSKGIGSENVIVGSYETITSKSEALTKKLANYDRLNQDNFETVKSALDSSVVKYENSKDKYEKIYKEVSEMLAASGNNSNDPMVSEKGSYGITYLQVGLGGFSRKEGVDLHVVISTSSILDPSAAIYDYFSADLTFTVTGEYMRVSEFIADLEDDPNFGWEINDFSAVSGSSNGFTGISARFVVRNVPIDKQSYLDSLQNGSAVIDANNSGTPTDPNQNSNTTTNTTTPPTTNSVDNSTTNTVVNTTTNTVTNTATGDNTVN